MTMYAAAAQFNTSAGTGGTTTNVVMILTAVTYDLRIVRYDYGVDLFTSTSGTTNPGGQSYLCAARRVAGGTPTGGTSFTPTPMRQGSAAATATGRYGTPTMSGGTSTFITSTPPIPYTEIVGARISYEWPVDLVISPGNSLVLEMPTDWFGGATKTIYTSATVYFEELRLAWPY